MGDPFCFSSPLERDAAMIQGRTPLHISFSKLEYLVKTKNNEEKRILGNVTGFAEPGQMLAIMGPSGSGKTSLIDILGGRQFPNSGQVLMNGFAPTNRAVRLIGFVPQDDLVYDLLTVWESLWYACQLRLAESVGDDAKRARVDQLVKELGLQKVVNSRLGIRGGGSTDAKGGRVSGGERKRVSIGVELVHRPQLLLADEPTSGLDSTTAYRVLRLLRKLAGWRGVQRRRGAGAGPGPGPGRWSGARSSVVMRGGEVVIPRTVICTIHQPSSRMFHLFDQLLLLAEGRVLYFGSATSALRHFSSVGHVCPAFTNPADFLLDLACEPEGSSHHTRSHHGSRGSDSDWSAEWRGEAAGAGAGAGLGLGLGFGFGFGGVSEEAVQQQQQLVDQPDGGGGGEDRVRPDPDEMGEEGGVEGLGGMEGGGGGGSPSSGVGSQLAPSVPLVRSLSGLVEHYERSAAAAATERAVRRGSAWSVTGRGSISVDCGSEGEKEGGGGGGGGGGGEGRSRLLWSAGWVGGRVPWGGEGSEYDDLDGYPTSFWKQLSVVLDRSLKASYRNPLFLLVSLSQALTTALVVGCVFFQLGDGASALQDRTGVLTFVVLNNSFSVLAQLNSFLSERAVVRLELDKGLFRPSSYFVAKALSELPRDLMMTTIFSCIAYWMVGLQASLVKFFIFYAGSALVSMVAGGYVLLCGAALPDVKTAQLLAPGGFSVMMMFSGFYVNLDSLPSYLPLKYVSFFKYEYHLLLANELQGLVFHCDNSTSGNGTVDGYRQDAGGGGGGGDFATLGIATPRELEAGVLGGFEDDDDGVYDEVLMSEQGLCGRMHPWLPVASGGCMEGVGLEGVEGGEGGGGGG